MNNSRSNVAKHRYGDKVTSSEFNNTSTINYLTTEFTNIM